MKETSGNGYVPIIAQAIEEMKAAQGDSFSLEQINLAELERRTGISRGKLRRLKKNGFRDNRRSDEVRKHKITTPLGFSYFLLSPSAHGMSAKELSSSAMLLPTPLASDTGDVGKTVDVRMTPTGSFRKYNPSGTVWTARLSWAVYKLLGSPPGDVKLNPDWVEWLMGFPRRWTDIPCGPKNRRKSRT